MWQFRRSNPNSTSVYTKFPTICGTGTEDYFCGSYNFDCGGQDKEFCTPYAGLHQVIRPAGTYNSRIAFPVGGLGAGECTA